MDNAPMNKYPFIIQFLNNEKLTPLFFPAYSPDLNFIEIFWRELKSFMKREFGMKRDEIITYLEKKLKSFASVSFSGMKQEF